MTEKPFMKQFEEAFDKDQRERKTKNMRWILAHPTWAAIIVFGVCAVLVVLVFSALGSMVFHPQAAITPEPTMTIGGFVHWVLKLEMQPIYWIVIFICLWMTKWS